MTQEQREIGEMGHDVQRCKYEKPKQVSVFEGMINIGLCGLF